MFLLKCVFLANVLLIGFCDNAEQKSNSSNLNNHGYGHDRIVGGFETSIEDNPWQIGLIVDGKTICGGSIIGEQWVLTAAHCLGDGTYRVRAGSSQLNSGGKVIGVDRTIRHPQSHRFHFDNDFGLLHLAERLQFSNSIRSIELSEHGTDVGTMCQVSGWGLTTHNGKQPERLLAVKLPIFDQKVCEQRYGDGKISKSMICAGYESGGKSACNGDSGGPLSCNGKIVGVVSFSRECAKPGFPTVFAKVAAARSWIKKVTGI